MTVQAVNLIKQTQYFFLTEVTSMGPGRYLLLLKFSQQSVMSERQRKEILNY